MTNRRIIRRSLFAAAMTVFAATDGTSAQGFDQGQYQPGQPGQQIPQGNTTVTQELNRMFQESGQQMPSMNPHELPNANMPMQGQVRLRQPQNPPLAGTQPRVAPTSQNQNQTTQAAGSKKISIIGRMFGKLRGNPDTKNANIEPNHQPPVPPDYKPAAPQTAASTHSNVQPQGQVTTPQQHQGQLTQNPRNPSPQGQPTQSNLRSETAEAYYGAHRPGTPAIQSSMQNSSQVRQGQVNATAPRAIDALPVANARPGSTTAEPPTGYTQPGSAPGFMSAAGATNIIQKQPAAAPRLKDKFQDEFIRENSANIANTRTAASRVDTKAAPGSPASAVTAGDASRGFANPFVDSYESSESGELLDLDALIEIPAASPQPVKSVSKSAVLGTLHFRQPLKMARNPERSPRRWRN